MTTQTAAHFHVIHEASDTSYRYESRYEASLGRTKLRGLLPPGQRDGRITVQMCYGNHSSAPWVR